jgi:DNA adenine methylase
LYRKNKKGEFNAPFGDYANPSICDESNIMAVHDVLKRVFIRRADFGEAVALSLPGDAVYFDPPFLPSSKTSSFVQYTGKGFGIEEHKRLAAVCRWLRAQFVVSNADTPEARTIFGEFEIEEVQAARAINSKGSKRGKVSELLITRS